MATRQLKDSAELVYTPPEGTAVVHFLAVPLLDIEMERQDSVYDWWAEDMKTRSVVAVDTGAYDFWATIRAENEPNELRDLLRLAIRHNLTVMYRRLWSDDGIPLKVVSVEGSRGGLVRLKQDPERFAFNEWMARVRFRRVDGSDLSDLIPDETL